jgi:hypothetical protein
METDYRYQIFWWFRLCGWRRSAQRAISKIVLRVLPPVNLRYKPKEEEVRRSMSV